MTILFLIYFSVRMSTDLDPPGYVSLGYHICQIYLCMVFFLFGANLSFGKKKVVLIRESSTSIRIFRKGHSPNRKVVWFHFKKGRSQRDETFSPLTASQIYKNHYVPQIVKKQTSNYSTYCLMKTNMGTDSLAVNCTVLIRFR